MEDVESEFLINFNQPEVICEITGPYDLETGDKLQAVCVEGCGQWNGSVAHSASGMNGRTG